MTVALHSDAGGPLRGLLARWITNKCSQNGSGLHKLPPPLARTPCNNLKRSRFGGDGSRRTIKGEETIKMMHGVLCKCGLLGAHACRPAWCELSDEACHYVPIAARSVKHATRGHTHPSRWSGHTRAHVSKPAGQCQIAVQGGSKPYSRGSQAIRQGGVKLDGTPVAAAQGRPGPQAFERRGHSMPHACSPMPTLLRRSTGVSCSWSCA